MDALACHVARIDTTIDPQTQQRRRLAILEGQQGAMGILTPPYITMEIEDLRRQLGDGGAAPAP